MLISIPAEVDPSSSRFQQPVDPYQSQEGFTSEVIDLCVDDEPEVMDIEPPTSKNESLGTTSSGFDNPLSIHEETRRTRRHRQPPKRFQDFRTGNTPKSKLFKVSTNLAMTPSDLV